MSIDNPSRNGARDQAEVSPAEVPNIVTPRTEVDLPYQSRAEAFERANSADEPTQEAEPLPILVDIPPGQTRLEHFESLANAFPDRSDRFPIGQGAESSEHAASPAEVFSHPAADETGGATRLEQPQGNRPNWWDSGSESTNDIPADLRNPAAATTTDVTDVDQTGIDGKHEHAVVSETPRADAMRESRPDRISPPAWERMCDGVAFNEQREPYYAEQGGGSEITLENGKRLDSYVPRDEIVSRKHTQLAEVAEATAINYVRELDRKYSPGQVIKDTPHNRTELPDDVGDKIGGQMILEVPPQKADVPPAVLRDADRLGIWIRDTDGTVYKLQDSEE